MGPQERPLVRGRRQPGAVQEGCAPMTKDPNDPVAGRQPGTGAIVRRRALVAASDTAAQRICRSALETAWDVEVVDSGVAAVIAARRSVPAVIFVDLQLRDVPGGEAVGWLRSNPQLGSVPIVLIAGGSEDDREIAALHPHALLRKPVSRGAVERLAGAL